jgi:YVTN family beta-propeller protein
MSALRKRELGFAAVIALAAAVAVVSTAAAGADATARCHFVTKRVHGKLRKVRVCSSQALPPVRPVPGLPPAARQAGTVVLANAGHIAFAADSLWVMTPTAVVRVDPTTKRVAARVPHIFDFTGTPSGGWITGDDHAVWVTDLVHDQLLRIDPSTNTVAATISVGPAPAGVAIGAGAVWVANHHGRSLSKVDPATNRVVASILVGDQAAPVNLGPQSVAYADGVWFVTPDSDTFWVERLDPSTGHITTKTEVTQPCAELIPEGAAVWAAPSGCTTDNPLARFSQSGVDRTVPGVGPPISGVTAFGEVWDVGPGKVLRIDPSAARVAAGLQIATRAGSGIAATPDALWVSTSRGLYRLIDARSKVTQVRSGFAVPAGAESSAALVVVAAAVAGSTAAAVPETIRGTFARSFHSQDFPNSEEPSELYTMKITPTSVTWSAKGLGVSIEQAKTSGKLLLVRDKPGSVGRLCAVNGWGTYRYRVNGKKVSFIKVKDPCKQRTEVLGKTWIRQH